MFKWMFFCLLVTGACKGQDNDTNHFINRKAYASGRFYTNNSSELKMQMEELFKNAEAKLSHNPVLAVISPHAGYVFSGTVAASGFNQLDPSKEYKHIFILAPSHTTYFNGASIYCKGNYETPLGEVPVDIEFVNDLIDKHSVFTCSPEVHETEHSLEVQLPFLQYHLKKPFRIVPVVIGNPSKKNCEKIATALQPYFNTENLFVISSDFSHYPTYDDAVKADYYTAESITHLDPELFEQALMKNESDHIPGLATSACGRGPIMTLLYLAQNQSNISAELIQYLNSGDSQYGDKNKVVGYHSIVFTENTEQENEENIKNNEFVLTHNEKEKLLTIARTTIDYYLAHNEIPEVAKEDITQNMKTPCGAFVTLHEEGLLRGCIGRFDAGLPLYKTIQHMAVAAATEDYRFTKVTPSEVIKLDIEISVLTPLKRIKSLDEFILGKHGIYIKKGSATGTFLPQVAEGKNWSKEEFVSYCSREKAGIGWDGWKTAELYTYEALIFSEYEIFMESEQ